MSNRVSPWRLSILLATLASTAGAPAPAASPAPAALISGYRVSVLPAHPNHPSVFPRAMDRVGVLVGNAGSDPWDNLATPVLGLGKTVVGLPTPFGSLNFALGLGSARLVVGTSALQPVAWVNTSPLVLQPTAGLVQGEGRDANVAGAICGTLVNDLTAAQRAVLWPSATAPGIALSLGSAAGSSALAISENGRTIGTLNGGAFTAFGFVGARWDDPNLPPLPILPLAGATNCELTCVNENGDSAGRCGFPNFSVEAVFHDNTTGNLVGLGFLPGGNYSEAHGVNQARVVVGVSNAAGGVVRAFRWDNGTLQDLNSLIVTSSEPILAVTNAVAINDLGLIAAEVEIATPAGSASHMALLRPVGP